MRGLRRDIMAGLLVGLSGLAITLGVLEFTPLDLAIQDLLYDPAAGAWLIDAEAPVMRAIFYTGPRVALWILAAALLGGLVAGFFRPAWRPYRRGLLYLLVCLMAVPAVAGALKQATNVACPSRIDRYGGDTPYVRLYEPAPASLAGQRFKCFPAGHASGGVALFGIGFLGLTRRRWIGFVPGLAAGLILGGYQMAKGAHYLSHTLVTLFGGLAICAILAAVMLRGWQWPTRASQDPRVRSD